MRDTINSIIIAAGLALLAVSLCGCNTTKFTKAADGTVTIENKRLFWSTDSYAANWSTNGASLEVNKSGTDSAALAALVSAAVTAAK